LLKHTSIWVKNSWRWPPCDAVQFQTCYFDGQMKNKNTINGISLSENLQLW